MATAVKRGKYWHAQWGTGVRGKPHREPLGLLVTDVRKRDADEAARERYRLVQQGRGPSNLPVLTWPAAVLQYLQATDASEGSVESRKSRRRKLAPWQTFVGSAPVPDRAEDVRDQVSRYLASFKGQRSASTINGYRIAITGLCNYLMGVPLVRWHYNPAESRRHYTPAPEERLPEILSDDDLQRVGEALEGHACHVVYMMLRWTGMRLEEALDVTWAEIDLRAGLIRADKTKTHRDRDIHIMPELSAYLRAVPRRAVWVCCSPRGKRWSKRNTQRAWSNKCGEAGLPCSRHALRRTCATLALLAGESPAVVAQQLGHSVQTLMRWYARLEQLRHIPRLGGSIGSASGRHKIASEGIAKPAQDVDR